MDKCEAISGAIKLYDHSLFEWRYFDFAITQFFLKRHMLFSQVNATDVCLHWFPHFITWHICGMSSIADKVSNLLSNEQMIQPFCRNETLIRSQIQRHPPNRKFASFLLLNKKSKAKAWMVTRQTWLDYSRWRNMVLIMRKTSLQFTSK